MIGVVAEQQVGGCPALVDGGLGGLGAEVAEHEDECRRMLAEAKADPIG